MGSKSTASLALLTTFIVALFSSSCHAIKCYDTEQLALYANSSNLNMKSCISKYLFCSAFRGYSNDIKKLKQILLIPAKTGVLYYLMRCDNYDMTSKDITLNRCYSNDSYANTYTNAVACFCDADYCNDADAFTKFTLLSEPTSTTTTAAPTTTTTTMTTTFITPKANDANDVKLNVAVHALVTAVSFLLGFSVIL
ncbi:hypothetical protein HELRODRAFT_191957 [Helobdella robusta]|uniref:Protein quiver n=1 Tax=Helobdella robusta TaxID=6412 RepID=T1FTG1_HELRO|nr:hypothetical protein HELRODRAFT_191957 [Helobdella robusta]ESO03782.1 hypothetical protein HELRODRAFT_191957 [Helobdella robusta]